MSLWPENTLTMYKLTPAATADLIDIQRYTLEKWGKAQSVKYLESLHKTAQLLAENPLMGKTRPDVKKTAYSFAHHEHVVYYAVKPGSIVIFAVLHQTMLPKPHLADRKTE